jgi:hypothetical protein
MRLPATACVSQATCDKWLNINCWCLVTQLLFSYLLCMLSACR